MDKLVGNALGSDGIAKIAGQKVGDMVETTVKNAMSGGKKKEGGGAGGAGGAGGGGVKIGVDDALSFLGGKKDEHKEGGGGFDIGNVLSFGEQKK